MLYDELKAMIENKQYTIVQCQNMLDNYYKYLRLTDEQYEELMELSKTLEPNSDDDIKEIEYTQLEKRIEVLENEIELIKQTISEGGGEVPPIETPDGSKENPITAYAGMTYYKDKYYKEKQNVYLCTRDSDSEPGSGIVLNYLSSQLVGIYFSLVEE